MTGFHSVILNPDSVNLVKPPRTTIPKTNPEVPNSHHAVDLEEITRLGLIDLRAISLEMVDVYADLIGIVE